MEKIVPLSGGAPRLEVCPRCIARGKTWKGSDPKCAFVTGVFSPDNWMCATANALRDACHEKGHAQRWSDDSIGYVPLPEAMPEESGFLLLLWYKDRGCTSNIQWMQEDFATSRPVTLELAERALNALGAAQPHGERLREPSQNPIPPSPLS